MRCYQAFVVNWLGFETELVGADPTPVAIFLTDSTKERLMIYHLDVFAQQTLGDNFTVVGITAIVAAYSNINGRGPCHDTLSPSYVIISNLDSCTVIS